MLQTIYDALVNLLGPYDDGIVYSVEQFFFSYGTYIAIVCSFMFPFGFAFKIIDRIGG